MPSPAMPDRRSQSASSALADSFVTGLWSDPEGYLWVTTNRAGAINRYDPRTESMMRERRRMRSRIFSRRRSR